MARKINSAPHPHDDPATDLDVIHPNHTVVIAGRTVTVREYGFIEGLQLERQPHARQVLDALVGASQADPEQGFGQILAVLADHPEALLELVAQAADVEPAFIEQLGDADGQSLLMTWWLVNGGFFVRRVVRRLAILHAAAQQAASAGPTSTKPSSSTATVSPSLAAIPDAN